LLLVIRHSPVGDKDKKSIFSLSGTASSRAIVMSSISPQELVSHHVNENNLESVEQSELSQHDQTAE
jgi:hypothetical protein